jgi:hypothetical protein
LASATDSLLSKRRDTISPVWSFFTICDDGRAKFKKCPKYLLKKKKNKEFLVKYQGVNDKYVRNCPFFKDILIKI